MRFLAPNKHGYETLLRVARSSVAEPPWFATLIDATEDDEHLTLVFDVADGKVVEFRAEAYEHELRLLGVARGISARRICALPFKVPGNKIEAVCSTGTFTVRIPKRR